MARVYTGNISTPFQASVAEATTKDYSENNPETQLYAFQPKYSQEQIELWSNQYRAMPSIFSDDAIKEIEDHSQHYGMMFNRNLEDEEFRIFDMLKQAGSGWLSGFTTLELGEAPKNEWEGIARSLGHLGGFIGVIPGVGMAARSSALGGSAIIRGLAKLQGKSIPMLVAGQATKRAKSLAKGLRERATSGVRGAGTTASEFMHNKIATDVIEGAFHLGTASAVSSWTHGVDAMLSSALHGAAFGGVFKSIGNFLKSGAKGEQALGENLVGSVAGSLFQGLPATLRGATTKEQIYEYLMGAYFGFKEGPYHVKTGQKYGAELTKLATEKSWPAEKLQEKVAEDLVNKKWDAKEREQVKQASKKVIDHQTTLAQLREFIKLDPTLEGKLEALGVKVKMTKEGEVQAEPDKVPEAKIEAPKPLKDKTKPTKSEVLKEDFQDTGTVIEYDGISSAVKAEAEKNLSASWKKEGVEDLFVKKDKIDKLQKHLNKMAEKKSDDVDELAQWLKKEYNYDITGKKKEDFEARAFYKNYLVRRKEMRPIKTSSPFLVFKHSRTSDNLGNETVRFKSIDKIEIDQLDPTMPVNRANNNKAVDSPVLFVEQVYAREMANRNKPINLDKAEDRPLERIDSFVLRGQPHGNFPKEYKFSELKDIILRDVTTSVKQKFRTEGRKNVPEREINERVSREVQRHTDQFIGEITKHYQKQGMHYFSGRGDGDVAFYIKTHPNIAKSQKSRVDNHFRKIKKFLKDTGVPNVDTYLREDMNNFANRYGKFLGGKEKAKLEFKRTYVSNVLWEMSNNGLNAGKIMDSKSPVTPVNFQKGFISDVIQFNKRQQIWLTNGVSQNPEFMSSRVSDLSTDANGNVVAKTILFSLPKSGRKPWEERASDMEAHFDGGTPVRSDFVDALNEGVGHPMESGVSKNFVTSPDAKHGALLMKHMMFDAGKVQNDFMLNQKIDGGETGVHFFTPTTSAKQIGSGREVYTIRLEKDGFKYTDSKGNEVAEPKAYNVPVKDIRTVMSEKTSDHNIGATRLPKQVGTNILTTLYHGKGSPVTKEIIDNWFKDHHLKHFHGSEESNALLQNYKKETTPENLEKVIENLETISTPEIVKLLTEPGYNEYAGRVLDKMARINRELEASQRQEGEKSNEKAEELIREIDEFKGVVDRNLQLSDGGIGVWLHKMNNPYRETIVKNYIVNNLTRPVMDNGMTARMTVYDWELQQRFPELETQKDLYYLGDSMKFKDIRKLLKRKAERDDDGKIIEGHDGLIARLETIGAPSGPKKAISQIKTLGELWEYREGSNHTKVNQEIDAFFEGINVRVPMDSGSGAHVLKFGGFMGRRGYNVLVHPESMKALGGADSDGDKAFIFFDMKPEYKTAFKNARNEFVEYKHKTIKGKKIDAIDYAKLSKKEQDKYYETVSDNKEEYRKDFTLEGEFAGSETERNKYMEKFKNRARMYSPNHRMEVAGNASGGRGGLGPAVVSRQVLGAAHASISESKNKRYEFTIESDRPSDIDGDYVMLAKMSPKELQEARKLARASIAFPSDPLDEVGLVHRDVSFQKVFEGFFELVDANTGEIVNNPRVMRQGLNKVFSDINSALFGKDVQSGKAWSYQELNKKLESVEKLDPEQRASVLAKLAETIKPIDWQDNLIERINYDKLEKMYIAHQRLLKETRGEGTDSYNVARTLNRAGFPVKGNDYVKNIFDKIYKPGEPEYREAADFVSNDIHNMVAFRRGLDYWVKSDEAGTLKGLGEFVSKLYGTNYNANVDASVPYLTTVKVRGVTMKLKPSEYAQLQDSSIPKNQIEVIGTEMAPSKTSHEVQGITDKMIREFKENLSDNDKKSLDWLLISGYRVPEEATIKEWRRIKQKPEFNGTEERQLLSNLVHKSSQTRFAFQSPEVNDAAIKQFWKDYSEVFEGLSKPKSKEVEKDIDEASKLIKDGEATISGSKTGIEVEGHNKNSPKPNLNEDSNFRANYTKVLGDLDAFKRISEMKDLPKLTSEEAKQVDRLVKALDKQSRYIGGDLELFIRNQFGKEPDQMTRVDFDAMVNMLENPGSYYQANRAKFHENVKTGKKDAPIVSKWVHMMFPRSIDRLWLSKEMRLVETISPAWHKNKKGEWEMSFVKGKKLQHRQGQLQYTVSNNQRISQDQQTIEENRILSAEHAKENLAWLSSVKEADRLHELAIIRMEAPEGRRLHAEAAKSGGIKKGKYGDAEKYRIYELDNPNSELSKEIAAMSKKKLKVTFEKDPMDITGEEAMQKIQDYWTKKMKSDFTYWVKGEQKAIDKYFYKDKKGIEHARVEDFVRDVEKALLTGQKPHEVIRLGNDHINKMATHVMIRNETNAEFKKALNERLKHYDTQEKETYWHHTRFDQAELTKALEAAKEQLKKTNPKNQRERERLVAKAAKLSFQLKNITGDINIESMKNWSLYELTKAEINRKISEKDKLTGLNTAYRHASQSARTLNVGGWDKSPAAGVDYVKGQVETFYSNLSQIMGREVINRFTKDQVKKYKKNGKVVDKDGWANAKAWKNVFEMYLNEALGHPSVIPDHVLENPRMRLKGTPYAWWSDSNVKNKINKIAKAMGINKKDVELFGEIGEYMDYNKLRGWTNLEAKYQLATLLAHPKTAIANVFGGSTLTIQSTGLRHWRNARNHQFLKDNIDPTWTTKEDAGKWVESLGVIEQFLRYEMGISPHSKNKRTKQAFDKLAKIIKKDPSVSDVTLKQAWRETGLTNDMFNRAAYFMRKSERMLRRDSFLAHYLQAKDMFGEAISGKGSKEHPFLIEWARRGVQDTQFLYTAAFRPAFARSALGKVMTRFQLWAWNSVSFRNKVLREAKHYGFKEGTPEFERFKRTASIDLMVFGLANAFTYSLFEANLPAPYNWMQDTADWLFGDEKTRDRAFFGAYPNQLAPLQMITPPAGRLVGPTMKAMIDDDWGKMGSYYAWTMFPFGRMARDVKNSVQNPIRTVENLTGIPYIGVHRYLKKTREIGEEDE